MRIHRSSDPADGGEPTPPENKLPPSTAAEPAKPPAGPKEPEPAPAQAPKPAPPPAAKTVLEGKKTEREVALEEELKRSQTRQAELEDENHGLKSPKQPATKPGAEAPKQKKSWLEGATFFD